MDTMLFAKAVFGIFLAVLGVLWSAYGIFKAGMASWKWFWLFLATTVISAAIAAAGITAVLILTGVI